MKNDYATKNGKEKPVNKSRALGKAEEADFRGYINLNLSPEEKEAYLSWAEPNTVFTVLGNAVEDGVHLSVRGDRQTSGYIASATQRRASSPNAGLCVTMRASDPVKALGRLLYGLAILARSERWEDTVPLADPDRW